MHLSFNGTRGRALDFGADKESVPGFPACDSDQFPAVRDAERLRL